jgi:hypothetical protein
MLKEPNLPPLAQYRPRSEYVPQYGDYIIWSGWMSTWHGFVVDRNKDNSEISVIWAGVPFLLLTMDEDEQKRETRRHLIAKIKRAPNGEYAIQQQIEGRNTVWYV